MSTAKRLISIWKKKSPKPPPSASTIRCGCISLRWARSRCFTREQEIAALAKKDQKSRARFFRSKVLESDYCLQAAVDILQQVDDGDLPFDRTMKISTAEDQADKGTIGQRIPTNLNSVRVMLQRNRDEWTRERDAKNKQQVEDLKLAVRRRRRRCVKLLEELSLRTSKVAPLHKKLSSISTKMIELEQRIEELKKMKDPGEDLEVCQEELAGLEDLVLEDAQSLHKRVVQVRKIFYKYEDAKRKLSGGNLRLVVSIAKKYRNRGALLPRHHPGRQHRPDARGR